MWSVSWSLSVEQSWRALRDLCMVKMDLRERKWAIQLFYPATTGLAREQKLLKCSL